MQEAFKISSWHKKEVCLIKQDRVDGHSEVLEVAAADINCSTHPFDLKSIEVQQNHGLDRLPLFWWNSTFPQCYSWEKWGALQSALHGLRFISLVVARSDGKFWGLASLQEQQPSSNLRDRASNKSTNQVRKKFNWAKLATKQTMKENVSRKLRSWAID